MMARHNQMKNDLDEHIAKINRDKQELERQFEDMRQNLTFERDTLAKELTERKQTHERIVADSLKNIENNKHDIENLNIINNNTLQEKIDKENELERQRQNLINDLDALRTNNAILLKDKEDKITFLANQSENLTKEKNLKIELNKELGMQRNDLENDLEKAKIA